MNETLKKIYDDIVCYQKETVEAGWRIDREIKDLIHPYEEKLDTEQLDELKSIMSQTAYIAEREGFEIGVRFALKLFTALLS